MWITGQISQRNHFRLLNRLLYILYNVLVDITTHSRILSTWTHTSKISRVKNLVPRSGILSTTAGNKNTRPWYKKYHCWHFNHKPIRKGRKSFMTQQPFYHFKKEYFIITSEGEYRVSLGNNKLLPM